MKTEHIKESQDCLIITIPETKTYVERRFTVIGEIPVNNLNLLDIYRRYKSQRPKNIKTSSFFLQLRHGKCISQVVGINNFSRIPVQIAKYLKLPDPESYTGHSFRRSSATLLANSGGDLLQLKKHGGWKSSTVAEGYVDDCMQTKMDCASKIFAGKENVASTSRDLLYKNVTATVLNETISVNTAELPSSVHDLTASKIIIGNNANNCTFNISFTKD